MKIINISAGPTQVFGLSDDGKLYYWNTSANDWSLYVS